MLDDVQRRRFLVNPAREHTPPALVGALNVDVFPYVVPIAADALDIAVDITSILPKQYTIGNIVVTPIVTFNGKTVTPKIPTSPADLATFIKTAFKDNKTLLDVEIGGVMAPTVYPIFEAQVVQFFNDDLSDFYGNFNSVLSACARAVFAPNPGGILLMPSTAKVTVTKTARTLA